MTDHIPNAIDRAVIAARWMAVNVLTAARERETRAEGELDSARRVAAARLDELAALNEHLGLNHDEIDHIDGDMLLQALGRRDTLANNGLTDDHDSTPATVDLSPIEEAVRALVRTLDEHGHHISQAEGEYGLADALVEVLTEHAPRIAREVSRG
ncbi:hypothetical protein [Cellulomonas palmilytica]|uniref:hypothetical protein n=1 Tax=Cellulomonas palmilytica TaxID=2608402 RepID=UPI001F26E355|nr:hypothetical protein [Cellulomonas palmilytica]UJP39343.1 hypothetical protein F1D97_13510 [Cellulomonas palmilytica]